MLEINDNRKGTRVLWMGEEFTIIRPVNHGRDALIMNSMRQMYTVGIQTLTLA